MHHPERRQGPHSRDTDALDREILDGYERWAGRVWAHRGKIMLAISMCTGLAGCVVGYIGRAHDLDAVRADAAATRAEAAIVRVRLDSTIAAVRVQMEDAHITKITVCSLSRRLDPAGTPAECSAIPSSREP